MIDPTTLSVIQSGLNQICNEMDLHLIRSALSPIISETNDCAHGIYESKTGEAIAQGELGLPVFLANMQFSVRATIDRAQELGGFREGDVWILNDTYTSGTHLNDVILVMPVFVEDELFALLASTGHWMDVGGSTAGGWSAEATEIHQEGIRMPPVRLYDASRRNDALIETIMANVRMPRDMLGDLTAMTSAVQRGEERLRDLIARHGRGTVQACVGELIQRAERQMRSYIAEIPDGAYHFTDYADNDGIDDVPIAIELELTVRGDEMTIDFTGTSPTVRGPLNIGRSTTISTCYVALKHVFPDVPINGGTFRPARIIVPPGTVVSAQYPAASGGYMEIVGRVLDCMFGALAQAIPERVPAAPFGTTGVVSIGGRLPDSDQYFVGVFPYPGGYGATAQGDGLVHGNTPQSMANFVALEASEHRYPVRFDYFALRENSRGAGRYCGGSGSTYRIVALAPCLFSVLGDRHDHRPFGLHGGLPAAPNEVRFDTGGKVWEPPLRSKQARQQMASGDAVIVASPGGGGYGDPLDRPVAEVERDLNLGYISREVAERDHAVVVADTWTVAGRLRYRLDPVRTEEARALLRNELSTPPTGGAAARIGGRDGTD
jgi:N-methylhydantoinase B